MSTTTNELTYSYFFSNLLNPGTYPGAIFYAIAVIVVAWVVGRALHLAIHRYLDRAEAAGADSTSVRFLGQLAKGVIYIIAFLCYARLIPALQSLGTTWLASVGVVSVVIGLATQSTLSNLVAGISLILYRPFRIGDRIQVTTPTGPEIGVVDSIDLGYTSLCTPDGRRIVLPNSIITNQTNINFSRNKSHVLWEVAITVPAGNDIDRVREILLESAKALPKVTKINGCFVTSISGKGTVLTLSTMCMDPGDIASIKSDLLESVKKKLDAEKIQIA
jgi:small conductance mechanosensitive channel